MFQEEDVQGQVEVPPRLVSYDYDTNTITIDGVRISAELIRAAFTAPGRRRHVIFEPDGSTRFLSSEPVGDTIVYTELAPAESWW